MIRPQRAGGLCVPRLQSLLSVKLTLTILESSRVKLRAAVQRNHTACVHTQLVCVRTACANRTALGRDMSIRRSLSFFFDAEPGASTPKKRKEPKPDLVKFVVTPSMKPGSKMKAKTPTGEVVEVTIPADAVPGAVVRLTIPKRPAEPGSPPAPPGPPVKPRIHHAAVENAARDAGDGGVHVGGPASSSGGPASSSPPAKLSMVRRSLSFFFDEPGGSTPKKRKARRTWHSPRLRRS